MPFRIVRNDITKMQVDAIVNTANEAPIYSSGTDTAVYNAAGVHMLLAARQKIGYMAEGEVAITPGFNLPAKYIIHAVSPCYYDGTKGEGDKLRACYEKSLKLALENGCESIAFPLIATGSFGYPKAEAMEIALSVINSFLMDNDMVIYLVVFDNESVKLSGQIFDDVQSFIDENYVQELGCIEYAGTYDSDGCSSSLRVGTSKPTDKPTLKSIFSNRQKKGSEADSRELMEESAVSNSSAVPPTYASVPVPPRALKDIVNNIGETFQQRLFRLIDERGREDVEVYKRACKDKKFFSKVRNNVNYQPSKHTVFAFAIALELSLDETKDLLASAGFAFSPSSKFDIIMKYVFEHKIFDMYKIDCILYDFGVEQYFSCE